MLLLNVYESELGLDRHNRCMPCIRLGENFGLDRVGRKVVIILDKHSVIRVCNDLSIESDFDHG